MTVKKCKLRHKEDCIYAQRLDDFKFTGKCIFEEVVRCPNLEEVEDPDPNAPIKETVKDLFDRIEESRPKHDYY